MGIVLLANTALESHTKMCVFHCLFAQLCLFLLQMPQDISTHLMPHEKDKLHSDDENKTLNKTKERLVCLEIYAVVMKGMTCRRTPSHFFSLISLSVSPLPCVTSSSMSSLTQFCSCLPSFRVFLRIFTVLVYHVVTRRWTFFVRFESVRASCYIVVACVESTLILCCPHFMHVSNYCSGQRLRYMAMMKQSVIREQERIRWEQL